jgi:alpha-tubulin suppressor-like RCC1 family protein
MSLHWMQIAGGSNHTIVATDAGDVYTFGDGSDGQLGNGSFERILQMYKKLPPSTTEAPSPPSSHSPVHVRDLATRIIHVAAGSKSSACLDTNGNVYTWGYEGRIKRHPIEKIISEQPKEDEQQLHVTRLGLGPPEIMVAGDVAGLRISEAEWSKRTNSRPRLVQISIDRPFIKFLSCGSDHTLCVSRDGDTYSWGLGEFGQLGHGTISNADYPQIIDSLCGLGASNVACGSKHSIVVTVMGEAFSFGFGGNGR